ncbi:MAG TPA: NADH-quinone oxidoreductase subunit M [Dermatophilaceae bacterium]|nr:NADH-quinone oxidoreductase subunit M [Dermatophilaceae bacterium]
MSSFPWLTTLGLLPLVGAVVVALLPASVADRAKHTALGFSLVTLLFTMAAALQFDTGSNAQFQLVEQHSWIRQFGVSYSLGVDGVALILIVMAMVLAPVCILAAWHDVPDVGRRQQSYFALLLSLQTFMVGVFAATDVFLFYAFFEAMLIPVYFLIGVYGGRHRRRAAIKFLMFSLTGGLIMLVAVIALYLQGPGGERGFLLSSLTGLALDPGTARWLFVGFFVAFAVKAPLFPVHTWLPDAASESPPAVAVLLIGVLDKVGTYGMIRFCLQLFPEASRWATPVVLTLAVVSVLYGAVAAIGQRDVMRLVGYTSISHFGFIVLGIFAMTSVGTAGSSLLMLNHGFSTAALFLVAAMLVRRRGSSWIPDYGGWQRVTPALAGVFLVAGLSALALPGLSTFISEFLVLVGTFQRYQVAAVVATLGIILAALYVLLMVQRMLTGPKPEQAGDVADLTTREKLVAAPLLAAFLVLGFYPKLALDVIDPSVAKTLSYVGVSDPAPAHPVAEGAPR